MNALWPIKFSHNGLSNLKKELYILEHFILWSDCKYETMKTNIVRGQPFGSWPLACLTEKRFALSTERLNQCLDWKTVLKMGLKALGPLVRTSVHVFMCVCLHLCRSWTWSWKWFCVIWSLWTDSFQQEITAICVAVSGRCYSRADCRAVSTQEDVSIATVGIDLSVVSNYWSVAVVRSAGRRAYCCDDKT